MLIRSTSALLAVLLSSTAIAEPSAWTDITRPQEGFQVSVPGKATLQEGSQDTQVGKVAMNTWTVEGVDGATYMVSCADYPSALQKTWVPSNVLEGAQQGALANVNGTMTEDRIMMLSGLAAASSSRMYPGREFFADLPEEAGLRARIYLVGSKLFMLMQVYHRGSHVLEGYKRFADSFKLLTKKQ